MRRSFSQITMLQMIWFCSRGGKVSIPFKHEIGVNNVRATVKFETTIYRKSEKTNLKSDSVPSKVTIHF